MAARGLRFGGVDVVGAAMAREREELGQRAPVFHPRDLNQIVGEARGIEEAPDFRKVGPREGVRRGGDWYLLV